LSLHRDRRRSGRLRCRAALAGATWTLLARAALAQDQLDLRWDAPPDCPGEGAVRQRIRSLAGESLQAAGRLHAEGRIVRIEGRYRLTLSVRDGDVARDRTIDADSCADLAGAAAVTLGLLLRSEPTSSASTSEPEAASTPSPAEPRTPLDADASPARTPQPEAQRSALPKRRWSAFVRAPLVLADFGRLRDESLGGGVGLGICHDEWCVSTVGHVFLGETLWSRDVPDIGVEVTRATAEIWTCRRWRANGLALAPCLTAGLDSAAARGVGPDVSARSLRSTSWVLGGGVVSHWYLADWVAVVGAVDVGIETSRPRLVIDGLGEVRQLGLVQVGLALGSEWIF
jgi:hypothetical protein